MKYTKLYKELSYRLNSGLACNFDESDFYLDYRKYKTKYFEKIAPDKYKDLLRRFQFKKYYI